jgi:hypothetical protein
VPAGSLRQRLGFSGLSKHEEAISSKGNAGDVEPIVAELDRAIRAQAMPVLRSFTPWHGPWESMISKPIIVGDTAA